MIDKKFFMSLDFNSLINSIYNSNIFNGQMKFNNNICYFYKLTNNNNASLDQKENKYYNIIGQIIYSLILISKLEQSLRIFLENSL